MADKVGIHIGNSAEAVVASIEGIKETIAMILKADQDQETLRKALDVLATTTEVKNISISDSSVVME